ncbi:MAG: lipopolysaccharide biosynthesis protein, partial [Acidimicrobiales bacterium]
MSVVTPIAPGPVAPRRRVRLRARPDALVLHAGLLVAAIGVGTVSLGHVDLSRLGDAGLITALPATWFVAVALLTVSFFGLLARPRHPAWLLWAHVLAAIVFLHGVTGFVEATPRFPTAWVHAGFAEHIMSHHGTLPDLDARFSWPGFFSTAALVASAGGVSPMWLVRWAPLAVNLATLIPLVAIFRTAGVGDRVRWVALWLFVVGNWVGQDYFAPQALGFLLFLVFVAVLLARFRPAGQDLPGAAWLAGRLPHRRVARRAAAVTALESPAVDAAPAVRAALVVVLLGITAAAIVSHQLTPFALVTATAALVVGRRTTLGWMPMLILVAAVAWISYAAVTYWSGHLADVTGGLGRLGASVGAG